jgi:drug/metabolite transporter (DMT)-like permease
MGAVLNVIFYAAAGCVLLWLFDAFARKPNGDVGVIRGFVVFVAAALVWAAGYSAVESLVGETVAAVAMSVLLCVAAVLAVAAMIVSLRNRHEERRNTTL